MTAIILVIIGLGFVLAEVFFPSLGMFGILAGGCILFADIAAFDEGQVTGYAFVAVEIILIPLVVRFGFQVLPKLPFGRRMILQKPEEDLGAGLPDLARFAGRPGVALSALRPGGMARIDGERLSVVSVEGMLDEGANLIVTAVEGAEIRVRSTTGE